MNTCFRIEFNQIYFLQWTCTRRWVHHCSDVVVVVVVCWYSLKEIQMQWNQTHSRSKISASFVSIFVVSLCLFNEGIEGVGSNPLSEFGGVQRRDTSGGSRGRCGGNFLLWCLLANGTLHLEEKEQSTVSTHDGHGDWKRMSNICIIMKKREWNRERPQSLHQKVSLQRRRLCR